MFIALLDNVFFYPWIHGVDVLMESVDDDSLGIAVRRRNSRS
jgi:hypothetical protein